MSPCAYGSLNILFGLPVPVSAFVCFVKWFVFYYVNFSISFTQVFLLDICILNFSVWLSFVPFLVGSLKQGF